MNRSKRSPSPFCAGVLPTIEHHEGFLPDLFSKVSFSERSSYSDINSTARNNLLHQTPRSHPPSKHSLQLWNFQPGTVHSMSQNTHRVWCGGPNDTIELETQYQSQNYLWSPDTFDAFYHDEAKQDDLHGFSATGAWENLGYSNPYSTGDDNEPMVVNPADLHISPEQSLYQFSQTSAPQQAAENNFSTLRGGLSASATPRPFSVQPEVGTRDASGVARAGSLGNIYFDNDEPAPSVENYSGDGEQPYNKLLYGCLMQAPDHSLSLKEIYAWFQSRYGRKFPSNAKGWQNSIRHNLSMNPAFVKGSKSDSEDGKKNVWSLTAHAISYGIEPTTRFRNHNRNGRKSRVGPHEPALQRQMSGAKGGRAARRSQRLRPGGSMSLGSSFPSPFGPHSSTVPPQPTPTDAAFNMPDCLSLPTTPRPNNAYDTSFSSPYFLPSSTPSPFMPGASMNHALPCASYNLSNSLDGQYAGAFANEFGGPAPFGQQTPENAQGQAYRTWTPGPHAMGGANLGLGHQANSSWPTPADPPLFYDESEDDREQSTAPHTPASNTQFYSLGRQR